MTVHTVSNNNKKHQVRPYDTRGRIFPLVTTDLNEFIEYAGYSEKLHKTTRGLYFEGMIWVKQIHSPIILTHEFTHHILRSIGNYDGGTRLFFDFINVVYEEIYGFLRYKNWRTKGYIIIQLERICEAWNDFLDWQLCRDVD